jgi:Tat protein secretion system quality control protein TatD with DNase activity
LFFRIPIGYHPWFSHLISTAPPSSPIDKETHYRSLFFSDSANPKKSDADEAQFQQLLRALPDPRPLLSVIGEVHANLAAFPHAMLGEVGVDRVFRVPIDYTASPRVLTPFHIPLGHQLAVLQAQMEVAVELGRNISIHSVKAQQATIDLLGAMKKKYGARWNQLSVDMHSCGFSAQSWRDVEVYSVSLCTPHRPILLIYHFACVSCIEKTRECLPLFINCHQL